MLAWHHLLFHHQLGPLSTVADVAHDDSSFIFHDFVSSSLPLPPAMLLCFVCFCCCRHAAAAAACRRCCGCCCYAANTATTQYCCCLLLLLLLLGAAAAAASTTATAAAAAAAMLLPVNQSINQSLENEAKHATVTALTAAAQFESACISRFSSSQLG